MIMDAELLEEVEQPYLISLSDSQVSSQDIPSGCSSAFTSGVCFPIVNESKGSDLHIRYDFLSEEKHIMGENGCDPTFQPIMDFFESIYRTQRLKFWDVNTRHRFQKIKKSNQRSLFNGRTKSMNSIDELCERHSRMTRSCRSNLGPRKRFFSLPNLYSIQSYDILHMPQSFLLESPYVDKISFLLVALQLAKAYYFGDFLIKTLLGKFHSIHLAFKEKDILISELMKIYGELIIRHAETENKIDRMRFDDIIKEELSSSPLPRLREYEEIINNVDLKAHQDFVYDEVNTIVQERNDALNVNRELESGQKQCKNNQRECMKDVAVIDVKTSSKERDESQANINVALLPCDSYYQLCTLDNKINLDKMEKDILTYEVKTYSMNHVLSDYDSMVCNCSELFSSVQGNHLDSGKTLKNNLNDSYNKILAYAKSKRELVSHLKSCKFVSEGNNGDLDEYLPKLDIQTEEESFKKSAEVNRANFLPTSKNIMDMKILAYQNTGLIDYKLGMENTPSIHSEESSSIDISSLNEINIFHGLSSNFLSNTSIQEVEVNDNELMPKSLGSPSSETDFKISLFGIRKRNLTDNQMQSAIENDFKEISRDASPVYLTQPLEKSETSTSLGSIKLEGCNCWNELYPSKVRSNENIRNKIVVSPLQLDPSSSVDPSVILLEKDYEDSNYTSLDDAATGDQSIKKIDRLLGKTNLRRIKLRNTSLNMQREQIMDLPGYDQKKMRKIMNSLNKIEAVASLLLQKSEGLKNHLSLQLDSLS